jgi:hypothetical protein
MVQTVMGCRRHPRCCVSRDLGGLQLPECADDLEEWCERLDRSAQTGLQKTSVEYNDVSQSTVTQLRNLLDDLIRGAVQTDIPHQRRRDLRGVGKRCFLVELERQVSCAPANSGPSGWLVPWRAKTSLDAHKANAFAAGDSSAASTDSRLLPVLTVVHNAGVTVIGSLPASEAAERTASSPAA